VDNPIIIQADIPEPLHDAFRALLETVGREPNLGSLIAKTFMAGVNAERDRASGVKGTDIGNPISPNGVKEGLNG
jgi:hypothetical protein